MLSATITDKNVKKQHVTSLIKANFISCKEQNRLHEQGIFSTTLWTFYLAQW